MDTESKHYSGPRQYAWLKRQLRSQAYKAAAFRIVTFHKPPYTNLWSRKGGYDGEEFVRDKWVPLFQRYRVDLVVAGHSHAYERGREKGVTYVTVGGGGGRLDTKESGEWEHISKSLPVHHYNIMRVDGGKLEWRAYNVQDSRIDRFVLRTRNRHWRTRSGVGQ